MALELKKPQSHDFIFEKQMIFIEAVDGKVTFKIEISRETLEEIFGLDGNDSHAVDRAVTGNWEAIEAAARKKWEGRVTESGGSYRLLDQDFK